MSGLRGALLVVVVLLSGRLQAGYIDPHDREWRQPKETLGYSYADIDTLDAHGFGCSAMTRLCAGRLGGVGPSVDGWIWATIEEVAELMTMLGVPGLVPLPDTPFAVTASGPGWGASVIDLDGPGGSDSGAFDPTSVGGGLTATVDATACCRTFEDRSYIFRVRRDVLPGSSLAELTLVDVHDVVPDRGVWMYRAPARVPSPGTLWLAASGLIILAARTRAGARSLRMLARRSPTVTCSTE